MARPVLAGRLVFPQRLAWEIIVKCIIVSGVPGSGKTYYAETISGKHDPAHVGIASADSFVDYSKEVRPQLPRAHQECFLTALALLEDKTPLVIIDNTNLSGIEIAPYYLMAEAHGYEVEVLRISCPPEVAFERQQHGVPADIFDKMVLAFNKRDVAPWWTVYDI